MPCSPVTLCRCLRIATLLGLKLENFHPYPNIIDIYRSVENIPQNILFVRTPRLKIDEFRWATFLEKRQTPFPRDLEPPAKLTPRGLEVTKSCIFITGEFRFEYNLFATIYLVSCSLEGELVQFKLAYFGFENEQVRTINNAAIIIHNTRDGLTFFFGILVSLIDMHENDSSFVGPVGPLITGNQKDTRYSRFQTYMDVWRITPTTRPELERLMATPGRETCHLSGELVPNVKICVD